MIIYCLRCRAQLSCSWILQSRATGCNRKNLRRERSVAAEECGGNAYAGRGLQKRRLFLQQMRLLFHSCPPGGVDVRRVEQGSAERGAGTRSCGMRPCSRSLARRINADPMRVSGVRLRLVRPWPVCGSRREGVPFDDGERSLSRPCPHHCSRNRGRSTSRCGLPRCQLFLKKMLLLSYLCPFVRVRRGCLLLNDRFPHLG